MSSPLNKYSSRITQPKSQGASQAMLYATNLTPEDMNKPQVGIASVWFEGNPCNMHLLDLAAKVKEGVQAACGSRVVHESGGGPGDGARHQRPRGRLFVFLGLDRGRLRTHGCFIPSSTCTPHRPTVS